MTINTIMLVALGFLAAMLLAVIIAPAYRNRTMRLTAEALRRSLPVSETEIRAERDRMRAEHAIRIHNLEAQLERVTLGSARQKIEVNRRDARISELEGLVNTQTAQLEELDNAKRVLEQTVVDRLPRIEGRLGEAQRLLQQRDGEVTTLADTAQRQARAIAEAAQINTQQGVELDQLKTALSTRAARNQDALTDSRFDGEVALRTEIEALRAKARDQASLIDRLQAVIANPASGAEPGVIAAVSGAIGAASKATLDASAAEFARLHAEFTELRSAYALARAKVEAVAVEKSGARASEGELRKLRSEHQDLTADVARLKAALAAYEGSEASERGAKDTPIAMKAKISALEALSREQTTTIETLRAEVTAVNERLARQSAHYMDEMKKLGAGTVQTSSGQAAARPEPRRSLAERISDPRVVKLTPLTEKKAAAGEAADTAAAATGSQPGRIFSLVDPAPADAATAPQPQPSLAGMSSTLASQPSAAASGSPSPATSDPAKPRRPRLLERITSIENSGE